MYVHRVVVDANHINALGGIPAMNSLEALDNTGLIEIFQTSTLPVEMRPYPPGYRKSQRYAVIGSNSMVYVTSGRVADSQLGASGRKSRFMEIHQLVFGAPASEEKKRVNDMRDALHIDQANQHGADFFVTGEDKILKAAPKLASLGIITRLCTADDCLGELNAYFARHYSTTDQAELARRFDQAGPILIGSRSFGGVAFADTESSEELLAFELTADGTVAIRAVLRDQDGSRLLTITPGMRVAFERQNPLVTMEAGPSPLLVGESTCRSFAVAANGKPLLAGRILRSRRLLIHDALLHNRSGRRAIHITRDSLNTCGITITTR
jgi:hypothetical protein